MQKIEEKYVFFFFFQSSRITITLDVNWKRKYRVYSYFCQ